MIILINSSKTMVSAPVGHGYRPPALLDEAVGLDALLKRLSAAKLATMMHLSAPLAARTHALIKRWNAEPDQQSLALDAFQGDIYRGLVAHTLSSDARDFADQHLRILSGLYGIIRPYDRIMPYRLELMYPFKGRGFDNLYHYWGSRAAETLPETGQIVNLASIEYMRLIRPFVDADRIVEPVFLTMSSPKAQPTFVAVHTKVARGAFARWLVTLGATDTASLGDFDDHGYTYDASMSTSATPTFIKRL